MQDRRQQQQVDRDLRVGKELPAPNHAVVALVRPRELLAQDGGQPGPHDVRGADAEHGQQERPGPVGHAVASRSIPSRPRAPKANSHRSRMNQFSRSRTTSVQARVRPGQGRAARSKKLHPLRWHRTSIRKDDGAAELYPALLVRLQVPGGGDNGSDCHPPR